MTGEVGPEPVAQPVVHIVDDDPEVRESVALMLERHGLRTAVYPDAQALLDALGTLAPGCLVVDLRMPGMDGLALQQELLRRGCPLPTIIVTGHAEVAEAVRAMKAGAVDFLEKPYGAAALLAAVRTALARLDVETRDEQRRLQAAARLSALSPREREVLRALAGGQSNKAIAGELGISPRTVEVHRARLMEKLDSRSLAEVVRIAIEGGLGAG